jgi:hypothetical protein
MHGGSANDVFMQERRRWSIVSKSSRGVYLLDADLKREFRTEGIVPNTWIWPDRMSVYLHMVPEEEVDYNKRGPGAYDALASGKVPSSFRGLPVYTSYPLDVDFNGRPISLLDRDRQIGEWTYITPEDEAIWIYSADVDRFVKITYEEAEKAALNRLAFQPTTTPADAVSLGTSKPASGKGKTKKPATTTQGTSTGSSGSKPSILIFRPFQTWTMSSAILCRAGSELGNTWHGHHDMQLQNDAIRKISKCPKKFFLPLSRFFPCLTVFIFFIFSVVGHYTFYSRAIVKQPKMVSVVEDVFTQGYVSGEGHQFFSKSQFEDSWREQDIGTKACKHSLIAWCVNAGKKEIDNYPDALDLLGSFPDRQQEGVVSGQDLFEGQQGLETTLGLSSLRPLRQEEGNLFLRSHTPLNTVCFRAKRYAQPVGQNAKTRLTHHGTGHWGRNVSFPFQHNCYLLFFSLTL